MKRAFTLIELLVVIAIIGILATVLMGTFSGGTESARSAQCLSNLRNLASAVQSCAVHTEHYPPAGSIEVIDITEDSGHAKKVYGEVRGWISWNSQGAYRNSPNSHMANASWNSSMYDQNEATRSFCMTNGALWKYLGGNHTTFICPLHDKKKKQNRPNWSYVMNAFFKWDYTRGKSAFPWHDSGIVRYGSLKRADKRLLFAEIPFVDHDGLVSPEVATGETCDSVLQYKGCVNCGSPESIGFNHKNGKSYHGNVAFADGHVEKLTFPKTGMSETQIQELTMWLCNGYDISFNGKEYDKMIN